MSAEEQRLRTVLRFVADHITQRDGFDRPDPVFLRSMINAALATAPKPEIARPKWMAELAEKCRDARADWEDDNARNPDDGYDSGEYEIEVSVSWIEKLLGIAP